MLLLLKKQGVGSHFFDFNVIVFNRLERCVRICVAVYSTQFESISIYHYFLAQHVVCMGVFS